MAPAEVVGEDDIEAYEELGGDDGEDAGFDDGEFVDPLGCSGQHVRLIASTVDHIVRFASTVDHIVQSSDIDCYEPRVVGSGIMSDAVFRVLGRLEAEVMAVMWSERGPLGVRAVLERLNDGRDAPLAYTTVMTVMSRLADKEILRREQDGRGYLYEAAVADAATIAVRNVVRDFGEAAVAGLVDQARADPKLRERLELLLRDE